MNVLAGEVVGVFAHVERADEHGAGRLQPRDQRRIVSRRRMGAVDLGAGNRRQPLNVEQVLDGEGHAGERQPCLVAHGVDRFRLGAGALGGHRGESIERRIEPADACQRLVDNCRRAELARRDIARDLRGGRPARVGQHRRHGVTP